jgi:hypothetical protein
LDLVPRHRRIKITIVQYQPKLETRIRKRNRDTSRAGFAKGSIDARVIVAIKHSPHTIILSKFVGFLNYLPAFLYD